MTQYDMAPPGHQGFSGAVLGGLGTPWRRGRRAAGRPCGVVQRQLPAAAYKDAMAFAILLTVLFLRPHGFSSRARRTASRSSRHAEVPDCSSRSAGAVAGRSAVVTTVSGREYYLTQMIMSAYYSWWLWRSVWSWATPARFRSGTALFLRSRLHVGGADHPLDRRRQTSAWGERLVRLACGRPTRTCTADRS